MLYPCHAILQLQPGYPCGLIKYYAIYVYSQYSIFPIFAMSLSNQSLASFLSPGHASKYRFSDHANNKHRHCFVLARFLWVRLGRHRGT